MNTPKMYVVTDAGKQWALKGMRPSEKVLLLALRIAVYERPQGIRRDELRAATGLPDNSFDRAWSRLLADKLVMRFQ